MIVEAYNIFTGQTFRGKLDVFCKEWCYNIETVKHVIADDELAYHGWLFQVKKYEYLQ